MTITIPDWVLWVLAIPFGIAALMFMVLGVMFFAAIGKGGFWR